MTKKHVRTGVVVLGLSLGMNLSWVSEGAAFCVVNHTETSLFARSLDSVRFQATIEPGEQACCEECLPPKRKKSTLLIVSGYVPVSKDSQPGWQGECRTHVGENEKVTVTGSLTNLSCR